MTTLALLPDLALRSHDATWNAARWEQLPEDGKRYEVIDGVLYMTTAPSSFHQWIISRIYLVLNAQVDAHALGYTFLAPIGVLMPHCDPVQPDLIVVAAADRDIVRNRRIYGVPALLVEILSRGNSEQDTVIKYAAYARAGVPEYWIVRPTSRDVIVYTAPDTIGGRYLQDLHIPYEGILTSPTLPIQTPVAYFFDGALDTTL